MGRASPPAKHTGALDGQCKPVKVGTDPDGNCKAMDASTCGFTGVCDGAGQCAKYKAGTVCKAASCSGSTHTAQGVCGASGCAPGKTTSCDDSNACTEDLCDAKQVCVHKETGKACDDKDACTEKDVCGVAGTSKVYTGAAPGLWCVQGGSDVMTRTLHHRRVRHRQGCQTVAARDKTACAADGSKWCKPEPVRGGWRPRGVQPVLPAGTSPAWRRSRLLASDGAASDIFGFSVSIKATARWWAPGATTTRAPPGRPTSTRTKRLVESGGEAPERWRRGGRVRIPWPSTATPRWSARTARIPRAACQAPLRLCAPGERRLEARSKLVASDGAFGDSRYAVAVSGDYALISAFQDNDKARTQAPRTSSSDDLRPGRRAQAGRERRRPGAFFGRDVAINGKRALVRRSAGAGGAAYVYDNGKWAQAAKLVSKDIAGGDYFGRGVALDETSP